MCLGVKYVGGVIKCVILGEQLFCLGRRFSKHKMTRYGKNFGDTWLRIRISVHKWVQREIIEAAFQICRPKRRASAADNQTRKPKRQNKFNSQ